MVNSGMKRNFVPSYRLFGFVQPDLQILAFLEVRDGYDMAHIVVDGVELGHSVNRARQIIDKAANIKLRLETLTFDLLFYCA